MAIIAAQASACFDPLNCRTCVAWQRPQASGPGSLAFAASAADPWRVPWQESQPTDTAACRESVQSDTMPGVTSWWQATQRALAGGGVTGLARSRAATAETAAMVIAVPPGSRPR